VTRPWQESRVERISAKLNKYRGQRGRLEKKAQRKADLGEALTEREQRQLQRLNGQIETAQAEYEREYRAWLEERGQAAAEPRS
jgi:flagellar motility protein MotE (MotC chaperone)